MKRYLYIICLAITYLGTGCQKDPYPYITKDAADEIYAAQHPNVTNVAFIYNNDVYYAADIEKTPVRITTTATFKKFIKMSHDHTKFAYLNAGGNIEIVDNAGKLITTLAYNAIKSFDWTADDK